MHKPNDENSNTFTVIIPARNEAENIEAILHHLAKQDYPTDQYEVIVVDDFSDDKTFDIASKWLTRADFELNVIQLKDPTRQGKKHGITAGVNAAKHTIILTTDTDCRMGKDWITSYNQIFDEDVKMVAGPVAIEGSGLFARFQQAEYAGLIGFGAVTISKNNPTICSGANLGFRKTVFEEVKGYENNFFTPSGDDEFMLHDVMSHYPNSVRFLKDQRAIVSTPHQSSWIDLQNQRTRWTSKWKHHRNRVVQALAVLFFLDYALFYLLLVGLFAGLFTFWFVLLLSGLRFLANYIYLNRINSFLKGKSIFISVLLLQILYPTHVLLMGVKSIFGNYTWKGRRFNDR
jgi:poly-beta-1,6-N-acetyl-D-glucosamine synthase